MGNETKRAPSGSRSGGSAGRRSGGAAGTKKKYYRRPHRLTIGVRIFIALMCALLAFLLAIVAAYYCGYRYITARRADGSVVRYVGKVRESDGRPISGRLYYSNGVSARINTETGMIEYSNGAVYLGDMVDFYR